MMTSFKQIMSSVDVEDRGKNFCVTVDLLGFNKEDVNIEVGEESLLIHAKKNRAEEKNRKTIFARREWFKRFTEGLICLRRIKSDDAKARETN